jgi:NADPH:quinone reductase-like Zn-dependent oxidoreductase
MKTLQFQDRLSLDSLVMRERPVPIPAAREVLVRVRAVSLNYRDLAIARGEYGNYELPLVPGSDAAGEVVGLGSGARRFGMGDRVCLAYVPDWVAGPIRASVAQRRLGGPADGVLSEYLCVHEAELVRAPDNLSALEAATLPIAGVTAWQALIEDGGLRPGDVVGVLGTGGVSLFVLQIARAAGARVLVVGRDADRLARARAMGAETVNSTTDPAWERRVLELSGGQGVDRFVDVVGGAALARSVEATRVGGTVCAVGFVGGRAAEIDIVALVRRALTNRAASAGSRASFEALVRAIETQALHPVVDRVFAFDLAGVRAAFAYLAEGHPFGKIVIDLGSEC